MSCISLFNICEKSGWCPFVQGNAALAFRATSGYDRGLRGRGAGVVERGGLENRCTFASTQGSNPCLSARCPNRPFSVSRLLSKTLQEWRVLSEKLRTQRFETLCGLSPKSLLCSPIFSKPPNPAVSGSELLGQYLWALRGLFSE